MNMKPGNSHPKWAGLMIKHQSHEQSPLWISSVVDNSTIVVEIDKVQLLNISNTNAN